jgi:hypothetical protein
MASRFLVAAALMAAVLPSVASADSTTGTVVAYDRKANIVVLSDKTIWTTVGSEKAIPADLKAGDRIVITYDSPGDDGVREIQSITIQ